MENLKDESLDGLNKVQKTKLEKVIGILEPSAIGVNIIDVKRKPHSKFDVIFEKLVKREKRTRHLKFKAGIRTDGRVSIFKFAKQKWNEVLIQPAI